MARCCSNSFGTRASSAAVLMSSSRAAVVFPLAQLLSYKRNRSSREAYTVRQTCSCPKNCRTGWSQTFARGWPTVLKTNGLRKPAVLNVLHSGTRKMCKRIRGARSIWYEKPEESARGIASQSSVGGEPHCVHEEFNIDSFWFTNRGKTNVAKAS